MSTVTTSSCSGYSLIREAADPALTKAERGRLVRALAARDHSGPGVSG